MQSSAKKLTLCSSPNIAFIKYWGKKESTCDEDRNIGLNPSLSMTLSNAQTKVTLEAAQNFEFFIQDKIASPKDQEKISVHIKRIEEYLQKKLSPFKLSSSNNFPTGTGIASSASAFSALTCAFISWMEGNDFLQKALQEKTQDLANLARRGSGSACRSLHGPFVEWNDRSITLHKSNWKLYDTILIFSKTEKKVSSTDGHKFATLSPLFKERLTKVHDRLEKVKKAISEKNLQLLGPTIEEEALEMHEIMRNNPHPVEYQTEECKKFLKEIQKISSRDFYFTLDAGPNVHLISEKPIAHLVKMLLEKSSTHAEIWEDEVGSPLSSC
jgi:diphosphomevalonate decarboxylase